MVRKVARRAGITNAVTPHDAHLHRQRHSHHATY